MPDEAPYTLPVPEILGGGNEFLNADFCAAQYAPFADGSVELSDDYWLSCIDSSQIGISSGQFASWESPEAYLFNRLRQKGRGHNIYRMNVSDGLAGTEELLIEHAAGGDTGL